MVDLCVEGNRVAPACLLRVALPIVSSDAFDVYKKTEWGMFIVGFNAVPDDLDTIKARDIRKLPFLSRPE